jgi:hypothetical protein
LVVAPCQPGTLGPRNRRPCRPVPSLGRADRPPSPSRAWRAALRIIDDEGLEALSLERIAAEVRGDRPRLSRAILNGRWPELEAAVARRDQRWRDEEMLEVALHAFISGVLATVPA